MIRTTYRRPPDDVITKRVKDAGFEMASQLQEGATNLQAEQQKQQDDIETLISIFTGSHDVGIPEEKRYVAFDAKSSKPSDVIFRVMGMLLAPPKCEYMSTGTKMPEQQKADEIERQLNFLYPALFKRTVVRWDIQSLFWQLLAGVGYIQQSFDAYYWDKNEMKRRPDEQVAAQKDGESDFDYAMRKKKVDEAYTDRVSAYKMYAGPPIVVESIDPRIIRPVMTPDKGVIAWVKRYRVTRHTFIEEMRKRGRNISFNRDGIPYRTGKRSAVGEMEGTAGIQYPTTAESFNTQSIDYYEYIDDEFIHYVVGDQVIDSYQHKGGIKIVPAYGLQTGMVEPHLASVGILWSTRNEIRQYDFYRTLWANKGFLEVFPQLLAILGEKDDPLRDEDGNVANFTIEPGTITQIRGTIVNPLKESASGTDFRALVQDTGAEIDTATIPGVARGQGGAQQPGYSINQLVQAMRTMWKQIIESRELQFSLLYEHYLWGLKHIVKQPVSVLTDNGEDGRTGRHVGKYVTLKPDDIDDYFTVIAHLKPDLPIDQQGQINLWFQLWKEGGATYEEFARNGKDITNPVYNQRQILRETMQKESMPKIIEDAQALARFRLPQAILRDGKFDKLNKTFSMDVQALQAARQGAQNGMAPADPMQPPGGMPPADPMQPPAPAAEPALSLPPTVGANPADSAPGPRAGDMSSGMGIR